MLSVVSYKLVKTTFGIHPLKVDEANGDISGDNHNSDDTTLFAVSPNLGKTTFGNHPLKLTTG
jgi:hypothetical protein